jgi:hypothetical protein
VEVAVEVASFEVSAEATSMTGLCVSSTLAACDCASIAAGLTGTLSDVVDNEDGEDVVATESVHAPIFTPRIMTKTVPINFERNILI